MTLAQPRRASQTRRKFERASGPALCLRRTRLQVSSSMTNMTAISMLPTPILSAASSLSSGHMPMLSSSLYMSPLLFFSSSSMRASCVRPCELPPICHAGMAGMPPGVELLRACNAANPAAATVPINAAVPNIPCTPSPESAEDAAPYAGLNGMPRGILYADASSRCKFACYMWEGYRRFACYMWEGYRRHTGPSSHLSGKATGGIR